MLPVHRLKEELRIKRITQSPERRVVSIPRPKELDKAAKSDGAQNDYSIFSQKVAMGMTRRKGWQGFSYGYPKTKY